MSGLTKGTKINALQGADICAIIKMCAETGVSELMFGELSVKFGKPVIKEESLVAKEGTQATNTQPIMVEAPVEMEMDPLERLALDDIEKAQLLIDNPAAYEESIMQDHLRGDFDEGLKTRRIESAL